MIYFFKFYDIYSSTKDTHMKNDTKLLVRMPKDIKIKFQELCDKELIDMSVKVRQFIYQELNKK